MSRAATLVFTRVLALHQRLKSPAVISGTEVGPFHTVGDTPVTVDPARLRASGEVVLQSVLEMAATE